MKQIEHSVIQLTKNEHGLPCRTLLSDHDSLGEARAEARRVVCEDDPEAVVEVVKSAEWHGWT